jgi:hypothetical protein
MAQPDATSEQVAKQCGTSADMIEEYYKGLVAPSLAEGWFSMQPEENIVSEKNVVAYTADKG